MSNPQSIPLHLPREHVLELAQVSIRPGRHGQLLGEYFPKVMPIVFEYGARPLIAFEVLAAQGSAQPPQVVSLFSWPSVDTFRRITRDPRVIELLAIRSQALEWIREASFFRAAQELSLELSPERHYALAASFEDSSPGSMPGRLLAEWVHEPDSEGDYRPRRLRLYELPGSELPAQTPAHTELFLLRPMKS